MATALNLGNANGKTITLRNPDTNNSDITVEMDKVVVKDASGNVGIGVTPNTKLHTRSIGEIIRLETSAARGSGSNYMGFNDTTGSKGYIGYGSGSSDTFMIMNNINSPIIFGTNGNITGSLDASGNLLLTSGTGALGYGTGAGGTVTQATSKSTPVTLNKPVGIITMNGAALASGGVVTFQVNNYLVSYSDNILITLRDQISGFYNYRAEIAGIYNGYFTIRITNIGGSTLSDGIVINVTVIKGANS